jgi:hypothetical protein
MEVPPLTRGATRSFHFSQNYKSSFGTANARRIHEQYSKICVRLSLQTGATCQKNGPKALYVIMYAQYAVANGQQVAVTSPMGFFPTLPSPQGFVARKAPAGERANEPPEKPALAISPKAPQDLRKIPVPPSSLYFNQTYEMVLALQTDGCDGKSISQLDQRDCLECSINPGSSLRSS